LEVYQQTKVEKNADILIKLLAQYIEKFGDNLVNDRKLSLNTNNLRYTNARLREWKRKHDAGEIERSGSFSWLWNLLDDNALSNSDLEMLFNTFSRISSLQVLGDGQETEIDLNFFSNLKFIEVTQSSIIYIRGAEAIESLELSHCSLKDFNVFAALTSIIINDSPKVEWRTADK
ncbi:hypothetical protein AKO1_007478, partial [Acrasis kona]